MAKRDKLIETLQTFNKPVTIVEWVKRIVELYPSILTQLKGGKEIDVRELTAILSLKVSKNEFPNIVIVQNEPYRKIQYMTEEEKKAFIAKVVTEDIEPVEKDEKIKEDLENFTELDRYRVEEFHNIVKQLNEHFDLNLILSQVTESKNKKLEGKYHADNLQILTKEHTVSELNTQNKFTIDEQKSYIKRVIIVFSMVNKGLDIDARDEVLDLLLERLSKVY